MTLPKFSELNSDYSPAEARKALKGIVEELNHSVSDPKLQGLGGGDTGPRYKALIEDIKKRADHTGLHGFKHSLKLHAGDVAEEMLLFVVDQAVLLSEFSGGIHQHLRTLAGGDPGTPEHQSMLLKTENGAALRTVNSSGDASKAMVGKILSDTPPDPPKGQPSAHDLLFYSSMTYQYLDKALWHVFQARKAREVLDAYVKNDGKNLKHCGDAVLAAFLLQTYMHHFHKAHVYASPMVALVQFCTHWCGEWLKAWEGSGPTDAEALNNLMTVYDSIFALRVQHKEWDCAAKGGLCYGPGDDAKTQAKPLKPMGAAQSSRTLFEEVSRWDDLKKYAVEKKTSAGNKLNTAKVTVEKFFKGTKFKAQVFFEESLTPLFKEEEFLKDPDVRSKDDSVRDQESAEEILQETKLQYERFAAWVLGPAANHDWTKDDKTVKRLRRKMVAGLHDDLKHEANPPYEILFKGDLPEGLYSRMMYDVYGLVEAKDLGKNVKNKFVKFMATKKKSDIAVTLLFMGIGIAVGIGTAGAGLPVLALLGITAGKTLARKAALKGAKAANSALNSKTLKGKDNDENTILTLNATQARESAQSMARHFVSSFKNFQRMTELKERFKANKGKKFYWDNCNSAAGYAYAAYAFDHHFSKTMARLQSLTAVSDAMLAALEEGEAFFASAPYTKLLGDIEAVVKQKPDWHAEHCDGAPKGAKPRVAASRNGQVYVSQNLPSAICYAPNKNNAVNKTSGSAYAMFSPARGLFYGDYILDKKRAYPPYDMFEHWVNFRDVRISTLEKEVIAAVEEQKKKSKAEIERLAKEKADQDALMKELNAGWDPKPALD